MAPVEEDVIQTPTYQATHKRIKRQIDHAVRRQPTAFRFKAEQPYAYQECRDIHQAIKTHGKRTNTEHNRVHSALQPLWGGVLILSAHLPCVRHTPRMLCPPIQTGGA